jgi:tetratricopeptide (TPR) repeat protein
MKPRLLSFFLVILLLAAVQYPANAQGEMGRKPSSSELYYDAVKAHMLGDDKQSEQLLKQVIAANPAEAAPYYDLSKLALKGNDPDKAIEYVKKAIELDGKNKWYREQYANALTLKSDFLGAAEQYASLAKSERFNETYLERSALLYQRGGKYKEALTQLEALRKKVNADEDVLMQEQQLYLKMNNVAGAAGVVKELISTNPKEPRYHSMLVEVYENNKQPEKAKEALEEMRAKFPTDPTLQMLLGSQALKSGDTTAYRAYITKAIINKDLDAETQIGLLRNYLTEFRLDSSRVKEAGKIIEQIIIQHPEDILALSYYGDVLSIQGKREQAGIQYKKAVSLKNNDLDMWVQLLEFYADPAGADSLIRYSEKAARLFPNQAIIHFFNGVGHYNKKNYPAAIKALNRAIDLQPEEKSEELARMHTLLGDVYNTTKQYSLSDSNYSAAIRLDTRNATALNNYAYYLSVRNSRLEDAAKMSQESLKIRPGEPTFLDTYGWILYQQGKYKDALEFLKKAIDANPGSADPTMWEHLGAVHYKMGNKQEAVAAWQKAKEKGSENASIDKMIAEQRLYE